jgi:hypothetical protein
MMGKSVRRLFASSFSMIRFDIVVYPSSFAAPKGAIDSRFTSVCLKAYPDTNLALKNLTALAATRLDPRQNLRVFAAELRSL